MAGMAAIREGNTNYDLRHDDAADTGATDGIRARLSRKRTKTGCLTCRRRRIKCDEEKPICRKCHKSHRYCEGYNQRVIFMPTDFQHLHGAAAIAFQEGPPPLGSQTTFPIAEQEGSTPWMTSPPAYGLHSGPQHYPATDASPSNPDIYMPRSALPLFPESVPQHNLSWAQNDADPYLQSQEFASMQSGIAGHHTQVYAPASARIISHNLPLHNTASTEAMTGAMTSLPVRSNPPPHHNMQYQSSEPWQHGNNFPHWHQEVDRSPVDKYMLWPRSQQLLHSLQPETPAPAHDVWPQEHIPRLEPAHPINVEQTSQAIGIASRFQPHQLYEHSSELGMSVIYPT